MRGPAPFFFIFSARFTASSRRCATGTYGLQSQPQLISPSSLFSVAFVVLILQGPVKVQETNRSSSSSGISVRSFSPPAPRMPSARSFFSSMRASIRSSMVPRQTNLCTRTFLF